MSDEPQIDSPTVEDIATTRLVLDVKRARRHHSYLIVFKNGRAR